MGENVEPGLSPVILWFRFDLRLHDHAGVAAALATQRPVLPVFIWDEVPLTRPLGAASRWWLHRSLHVLDEELRKLNSRLIVMRGATQVVLASLVQETSAKTVICSHTFDPVTEEFDDRLGAALGDVGAELKRFNTGYLSRPGSVKTKEDKPFRVFTPFSRALQAAGLADVDSLPGLSTDSWPSPVAWPDNDGIDGLGLDATLTPSGNDWAQGFAIFTPGERGARKALRRFLGHGLADYADGRDRPDRHVTSFLSAHLRFGEISPKRILLELDKAVANRPQLAADAAKFRAELIWREFNYNILHQQPDLHRRNFRADFDGFPWRDADADFKAWTRGETGYPLVDAGMRQLWQTGFMHNRVRMVTASFLIKHLLIDWRRGEQWFWDCLVDADPASNPGNWQWVAGSGADAAPYFRIFNPITQAEKFDPDGLYQRRFLGDTETYPRPIVDHAFARDRALTAYKSRGDTSDDDANYGD